MQSQRTVIVSDLHLGRPYASAGDAAKLRPIWEGAHELIINGDVAELHHPHYRDHARDQVRKLSELCEQDGVELTMLSGNHDPFMGGHRHLFLESGRILVTHGDALHPAIAPWSLDAKVIRQAYDQAYAKVHPEHRSKLEEILKVSEVAAMSKYAPENFQDRHGGITEMLKHPWMIPQILHYWKTIPRLASQFVQNHAPQIQYFIFGHTHRHGIWKRDGLVIINTGCFGFPSRPLAVVLEHPNLQVHAILRKRDHYTLKPTARAKFEVRRS